MDARARSAPAAFGRGISQVVANPGLLLAPLAFGGAMAAAVVAAAACVLLLAGGALVSRVEDLGRGPAAFSDFFEGLRESLLASPVAVLFALLGVLAALLLLTALAAWIRAGVTGSLAQIDSLAAECASLDAFRHPALRPLFFASARRLFRGFFALVNLYALAGSVAVLALLAPLVGVIAAAASGRWGLAVVLGVLFAVLVLAGTVFLVALRVVYLVAGRVLATERVDALGATSRAIALVRRSPGRAAVLYLLTMAGAMAVGMAFVLPRLVLTFAAGLVHAGLGGLVAVSAFFILLQVAAALAYDLAVTGAFVALWPGGAAPAARAAAEP